MPIQYPDFPMLSFQQSNPFLTGVQSGQEMVGNAYNNQIAGAQAQYALPTNQALAKILQTQAKYSDPNANFSNQLLQRQVQAAPVMNALSALSPAALAALVASGNLQKFVNQFGGNAGNIGAPLQTVDAQGNLSAPTAMSTSSVSQPQTDRQTQNQSLSWIGNAVNTGMSYLDHFGKFLAQHLNPNSPSDQDNTDQQAELAKNTANINAVNSGHIGNQGFEKRHGKWIRVS